MKQRFEYSEQSTAGFVELAPSRVLSQTEFFTALQSAPDVERVEWKETKTSQGNVGDHFMEQNIDVWVLGSARPIDFELTRNLHMKNIPGCPPRRVTGFGLRRVISKGSCLGHALPARQALPAQQRRACIQWIKPKRARLCQRG